MRGWREQRLARWLRVREGERVERTEAGKVVEGEGR